MITKKPKMKEESGYGKIMYKCTPFSFKTPCMEREAFDNISPKGIT